LGYSKEDRDKNIKRLSYVASEITKAGGIAILAAIAPYAEVSHAFPPNTSISTTYAVNTTHNIGKK